MRKKENRGQSRSISRRREGRKVRLREKESGWYERLARNTTRAKSKEKHGTAGGTNG